MALCLLAAAELGPREIVIIASAVAFASSRKVLTLITIPAIDSILTAFFLYTIYASCILYMRDGRLSGANKHTHLLKLEHNVTHGDGPGESADAPRRGILRPPLDTARQE